MAGIFGIVKLGFVAEVVAFAFGLAASSFFPVILLGIFDARTNRQGAIAGMIVGLAIQSIMGPLNLLENALAKTVLMGGGLEIELQDIASLPARQRLALSGEVKTLTLPGEMDERFKCLALGKGSLAAPSAFAHGDRTDTL